MIELLILMVDSFVDRVDESLVKGIIAALRDIQWLQTMVSNH